MIYNKIVTYISLANKSKALYVGFDAVKSSILLKKASLVILLNDASNKTKKTIENISNNNNCRCITINLESIDFQHIFNKKIVVLSLDNPNLSSAILKSI